MLPLNGRSKLIGHLIVDSDSIPPCYTVIMKLSLFALLAVMASATAFAPLSSRPLTRLPRCGPPCHILNNTTSVPHLTDPTLPNAVVPCGPSSQRRSAAGVVTMINRGVKAEDQNCAIRESVRDSVCG